MNTKKFIQILAVSATALITACEEELTSFDCETPITVTSQVSETTRAGYEGTTSLPQTFVMDVKQGSENYDYSLVTMTRDGNTNTYKAPANMLLLWKGTDHSTANVKAMTIPYGVNAIDANNAMTVKVYEDQTNDANVKASDLLGAKTGDGITINGHAINIEFRHLMSKLYVNYTFADGLTNKSPQVNSITLKNTCVKGGYSYKDMNYVNSSLEYGDIQMYHNSTDKATEAIFYPYTPTNNPQLEVSIRINGVDKTLTCPIQFKDNNNSFEGGKKYIMNIRINGTTIDNTFITIVKDWTEDNESIGIDLSDKKILWIGTSIPAGSSSINNYPTMIAEALGCTVVNNAVGGSLTAYYPLQNSWTADQWISPNELEVNEAEAYALSATKAEIASKYQTILTDLAWEKYPENMQGYPWNRYDANEEIRNQYLNAIPGHIARLQQYSYEELILPHINGTEGKEQCDVVVIDQGYNDIEMIPMDIMAAQGKTFEQALDFLEDIAANPGLYTITQSFKNAWGPTHGISDRMTYIAAMNYLINIIQTTNPNVQIVIGNWFASRSPLYRDNSVYDLAGNEVIYTGNIDHFGYVGECFVKTNEAIAAMHKLPIVNVYKHTGLNADNVEHSKYDNVFMGLCPDGIHPASDPTGSLNKIIANIYVEEFRKIFVK